MPRPRLIAHNVASLDGRITVAPNMLLLSGEPRWEAIASSAGGYERVMKRYAPEAILEGSGSFVSDAEEPEPLPPVPEAEAIGLAKDHLPAEVVEADGRRWFVVIDSRGRVRWRFKEFPDPAWAGWHLLVLVSLATPLPYLAYLRRKAIPYLVVGERRVGLAGAMARLGESLAVQTIVATGGSRLSGALLRAGVVDRLDLELMPALVGGAQTPALFGGPALGRDEWPSALRLVSAEVHADGRITAIYDVVGEARPRD